MNSRPDPRFMRGTLGRKKVNIEEVVRLQEAGQKAYKAANLHAAVQFFTQVPSSSLTSS